MTGCRPRLTERRRRRIAHVLREVPGTDKEDVDAVDSEEVVEVVDGTLGFDHADHEPLLDSPQGRA